MSKTPKPNKHKLRIGQLPLPHEIIPTAFTDISLASMSLCTGTLMANGFGASPMHSLSYGIGLACIMAVGRAIETAQNRRGCIAKEGGVTILEAWEQATKAKPSQTRLTQALAHYGYAATAQGEKAGAVVRREFIKLPVGTTSAKIEPMLDDIARDMGVKSLTFTRNAGNGVAAFDVPLDKRRTILLGDILKSAEWQQAYQEMALPFVIGENVDGTPLIQDLAKLVHVLCAGKTGSGKSALENAVILSLMQAKTPEQLRFVMIDPKQVELGMYEHSTYLLKPIITDMTKAEQTLEELIEEMEARYTKLAGLKLKNIKSYHEAGYTDMPYIVALVDEFADMMMVSGKKVEYLVARLGQKARAAGIHLFLITQRPSVDVVTGIIKAQCASRIGLTMASVDDSRTIIGLGDCKDLLGMGDLMFTSDATGLIRAHGAFVPDNEITNFIK